MWLPLTKRQMSFTRTSPSLSPLPTRPLLRRRRLGHSLSLRRRALPPLILRHLFLPKQNPQSSLRRPRVRPPLHPRRPRQPRLLLPLPAVRSSSSSETRCPTRRRSTNLTKTLLIWGEKDNIFPVFLAHQLQRHLGPKSRLAILKDSGHAVNIDSPNMVNELI
nr:hypothetical protein CFP56_64508 [Quercus suber]